MRTTLRLTLRQHRLGFVFLGVGTVLLLAVAFGSVAWLEATGFSVCRQVDIPGVETWTEQQIFELQQRCELGWSVMSVAGGATMLGANLLPLLAALLLAAPLVAVEVESTTAVLAWTLARGRLRWYLPRVAAVLVPVVVAGLLLAGTLDWLMRWFAPTYDPWASFDNVYQRGLILPARAAMVAGTGLLAGAVTGRQVPALVVGGCVAALVGMGAYAVDQDINRANAVRYDGPGWQLDSVYVERATGREVPLDDTTANGTVWPGDPAWEAVYQSITIGLPDSAAPGVIWRNVLVHAAAASALVAASAVVVSRRRPY